MNKRYLLVISVLLLVAIYFALPIFVRNKCMNLVQQKIDAPGEITRQKVNDAYRACVVTHGLKPEDLLK